jgi:tetratricopeptide (TPR) repeat protein
MDDLENLKKEVFDYLRKGLPLMALDVIRGKAPEEIKRVAEKLLEDPSNIKELDEEWKDILSLIYFSHFSLITNEMMSREGLVSWSISSLNTAKLARKFNLPELEARSASNAGKALVLMHMPERAYRAYLEADRIYRTLDKTEENLRGFVANLNDLGAFCIEQERFDDGERYLTEALEIIRGNPDIFKPNILGEVLSNLGSLMTELRKFDLAEEYYKESESIFRKLSEEDERYIVDLATVLNNRGAMYREMKRFDLAEEKFNEAKEIFEEMAERNEFYKGFLGDTYTNLAVIYKKTGRLESAEEAFLIDLDLKKELVAKNPAYLKSLAHSFDNLSEFYKEIGREKEAKKYKEEANKIYDRLLKAKKIEKHRTDFPAS